MIKVFKENITPLNMTNKLYCECEHCDFKGEIILNSAVNVGDDGKIADSTFEDLPCPECGKIIREI